MNAMFERNQESHDNCLDARPELHYQVGVTPDHIERARVCHDILLVTF